MEVSCHSKFIRFYPHPRAPLTRPCKDKVSSSPRHSIRPLFYGQQRLHGSTFFLNQSAWSNSKNCTHGLLDNVKYAPRTRIHTFRCFSKSEKELIQFYGSNLHNEDYRAREVVVRSELAGTGSSDIIYPLSGVLQIFYCGSSPLMISQIFYFCSLCRQSTPINSGLRPSCCFCPHCMAEIQWVPKLRGMCFYAVTAAVAVVLFVLMMVAHPFVLLLDRYRRKAHHLIAKIWALLTTAPFFKIEFMGLENLPSSDTAAVYVSNHQSFLDIYTLLTLGRSFKFISKTSIFLFPVVGWAMFLMGIIPLKRMDSRSQLECLKKCMDLVKKGASVFFFPEGTRSRDGKLGSFKKGAFSIAAKTNVPVVPITLIGTGKIMPAGMEGGLYFGSVKVVIHRPINGTDPAILCNEARNIIGDTLVLEG